MKLNLDLDLFTSKTLQILIGSGSGMGIAAPHAILYCTTRKFSKLLIRKKTYAYITKHNL